MLTSIIGLKICIVISNKKQNEMKIKTGIYNTVAMIYLIMGCDRALTRIVNKKEFVNF